MLVVAGTAGTAIGMEATVAHLLALGVRARCSLSLGSAEASFEGVVIARRGILGRDAPGCRRSCSESSDPGIARDECEEFAGGYREGRGSARSQPNDTATCCPNRVREAPRWPASTVLHHFGAPRDAALAGTLVYRAISALLPAAAGALLLSVAWLHRFHTAGDAMRRRRAAHHEQVDPDGPSRHVRREAEPPDALPSSG